MQDLDIYGLELLPYDGLKLEPQYEPPAYEGPAPEAEVEGGKLYTGSCHCGRVTTAIKVKPLDDTYPDRILEDNCSICQRGGYIWIYPFESQVAIDGKEHLAYYSFGSGLSRKAFCNHCGVHIGNMFNKMTENQIAALPNEKVRAMATRMNSVEPWLPVTLRMLNNLDVYSIKTIHGNGAVDIRPAYVNP